MQFLYSMHVDLVYHALTYLKVDNASNGYCPDYIEKMALEKTSLPYSMEEAMHSLQEYYNAHFQRLIMINFLPFQCTHYEEMKQLLLGFPHFTEEDKEHFVEPFLRALDQEASFYFPYWAALHERRERERMEWEQRLESVFQRYMPVFQPFGKPLVLGLSYSIRLNGRGFGRDDCFFAFVPYPTSDEGLWDTFFQAFHEYTHQFTDHLVSNISMEDGTHSLSEYIVLVADYYLVRALDPDQVSRYLDWISRITGYSGKMVTEEAFLEAFPLDPELDQALKSLLREISSSLAV
ncbi:hypothetical protein [Gorillibacterium sp. CAU 1737]|uniref:hypothetical protein n=1 Tax=Gorillibacterium sp. CAU 1737 TaxID=3140362 RepID=UPI003261BC90